jgi:hypothetical protein
LDRSDLIFAAIVIISSMIAVYVMIFVPYAHGDDCYSDNHDMIVINKTENPILNVLKQLFGGDINTTK